jgi:hypothetical protein
VTKNMLLCLLFWIEIWHIWQCVWFFKQPLLANEIFLISLTFSAFSLLQSVLWS